MKHLKLFFTTALMLLICGQTWADYTFHTGDKIYYDLTGYGQGCNIYNAAGNEFGTWASNTSSIIEITLTKDLTITSNSQLFKSGASNWSGVKASAPTEGQNMIVSTDGKTAHWAVYTPKIKNSYTIYFKNTLNWSNIYVHFYNASYTLSGNGATGSGAALNAGAMTSIDGTYYSLTYEAYDPYTKVCFTKDEQNNYGNFWQTEATYSDALDLTSGNVLWVPNASSSQTMNSNVPYYAGYWTTYPEPAASNEYEVNAFVADGCSDLGAVSMKDADNAAIANGTKVLEHSIVKFVATANTGYTFSGWFTTAAADGVAVSTNNPYGPSVEEGMTLYAKFEQLHYYIKHPWATGADADWSAKELTAVGDGTYSIEDYYGGKGCNWGTTESTANWLENPTLVGNPQTGDKCSFVLNPDAQTITITLVETTEHTYYIKHPWATGANEDWSAKELTAVGDGTYSIEDYYGGTGCNWGNTSSTANWLENPTLVGNPQTGDKCTFVLDPTAQTITITLVEATVHTYYIKHPWATGANEDWSVKELTAVGDGTYSIEDYYGGRGCNWGNTSSTDNWLENPTLVGNPQTGDKCSFVLNPVAQTITITLLEPAAPQFTQYYVPGTIGGENWSATANPMTENETITFVNVAAGAYNFKVTDGAWGTGHEFTTLADDCSDNVRGGNGENIQIYLAVAGDVTIAIVDGKVRVTGVFAVPEINVYSLVGCSEICGESWNVSSTACDMTKGEDGLWYVKLSNIHFAEAGHWYEYKVIGDHNYEVYQSPSNLHISVAVPGQYDVEFTFDATAKVAEANVIYTRDVTVGRIGTICLSKDVKEVTGAVFYEIEYMEMNGATPVRIHFVEAEALVGGHAYIFEPNATQIVCKLADMDGEAIVSTEGLVGTYTLIEDGAVGAAGNVLEGNYVISANKFYLCQANCSLPANRAYISAANVLTEAPTAPAPASRRRIVLNGASVDNATALENMDAMDGVNKVMVNGVIYIIRDGVRYNALGQLMD